MFIPTCCFVFGSRHSSETEGAKALHKCVPSKQLIFVLHLRSDWRRRLSQITNLCIVHAMEPEEETEEENVTEGKLPKGWPYLVLLKSFLRFLPCYATA